MKNSTFSAQVANNLLTLLQGYSKTIRLLLVMFLTLTVTTNAWGADYSATHTSNVSFTAGTNGSSAKVIINSTEYEAMKLGTSSKVGTMTFTIPVGTTKIHLHVAGWNGKNTKFNISAGNGVTLATTSITSTADAGINNSSPFTISSTSNVTSNYYKVIDINSGATTSETTITITTTTTGYRAVIWGVNAETSSSGGGGSTPTQLSAPTGLTESNITSSGATLSWNAVANASNYSVTINGNTETVTTNSYSATGLTAGTEYTWSVVAKGDGTNYTDSEAAQHTFTTKTASTPGTGGESSTATFTYTDLKGQGASGSGANFTGATKENIHMSGKGNGNNSYVQIYANNYLTFTPTNATITKIVLTATSGYIKTWSASEGTIEVSGDKATWTGNSTSMVTLTNTASAQARITQMDVTYTASGSDDPEPVIVKTLKSIAVAGMTTTFEQGDVFKFDGTCTATYSVTKDGAAQADETAEVTPTNVSTPDMNQIGTQTVYVTYSEGGVEKTDDYKITITENTVTAGEYCITPNNEFWGTNFNGSLSGEALAQTYTGRQDDITIQYAKGSSQYMYINDSQTRVYGNNSLTFSVPSGYVITAIAFTADGTNWKGTHTSNVGSMTDSKNWAGSAKEVTITFGGNCRITKICVTYEELDLTLPSAPTFNPEAGTYNAVQNVTISAEAGTTIYYTLDGTDPTTESNVYASAIEISETTTVKAIAVKDEKVSPIASATYTINLPLTTMDQIFAKATTVGSTATSVEITFGNWVVSAVKEDGKTAYVTDGTKGFIIYTASHGFLAGDILSGTVSCKVQLYKGSAELTELTSTTTGLTVSKGGEVNPIKLDEEGIATLTGVNTGAVIKINGTCESDNIIGGIKLYNTLFSFENLTVGAKYDVTGVYLQFESTKEILPRGAEDIVKTKDLPTATISIANISLEIEKQATIEATITPDAAKNTVTYTIKSGDEYITLNGTTITAKAVGEATITATIPESIGNYSGTTKDFTVTVTPKNIATLPFTFDGGKAEIEGTLGMSQKGLDDDYASSPKLKFDGTGDYVIIHFDVEPGILSYDIKGNSFSGGTFTVQESENGETYTDIVAYTELAAKETKTHNLASSSRYVKFIYTEKSGGNVALGNISIQKPDLRADAGLVWNPTSVTLTQGDAFTAPTLQNPKSVSGITYKSSNDEVATVTAEGVIALASAIGTATITATFDGDATYKPAEVSCTITVNALYTVTLNPNYPAGKTGTFKDKEGNTVNGNLEVLLPSGTASQALTNFYSSIELDNYAFDGFYTQAEGGSKRVNTGDITGNITFYAHWKEKYTITWSVNGNTALIEPTTFAAGDNTWEMPTTDYDCSGKGFVGWTTNPIIAAQDEAPDPLYTNASQFPNATATYHAVFAEGGSGGSGGYEKLTEALDDYSGEYLIVYETNKVAFNGGLTTLDATSNYISVTINDDVIVSNATTDAAKFTFAKVDGGYSILSASGRYIGRTADSNGLDESTSIAYTNTITITEGNADIIGSGGAYLRYNKVSALDQGQQTGLRFRYYKSGTYTGQQPIALYKKSGSSASYTDYTTGCHDVTITYYGFTGGYTTNCGGSDLNVIKQRVNSSHTIPTCTEITDPTDLGRKFLNLWKDQNGKEHKPGESFIVTENITLYAQWKLETTGDIELPADKEDLATTDIVVTGGKTLTIPEGKTITINSLTLKGGLQENGTYAMPVVNIPNGATLVRKNTTINLDLVVNSDSWYPFAVPFAVANNNNIDYLDPVLKAASTYNTHFAIKTYDGANRAIVGTDQENNWDKVLQTAGLQPGKGYIISAMTYPDKDTATIRIPMSVSNDWLANGEQTTVNEVTRNTVAVTAYTGDAATEHRRHAGWNFVANPYLANFAGTNASGSFINGEILINNGEYSYGGEDVPYVTIPTYNFEHYYQRKLSDATLSPAYSFFVQVGTDGTMTFETAGRQQAPASIAARNAEERPVKMDVDITLSDNHSSDQTGIIISDRYSDAYEIGRDLEKLFGSAYNLSVYTLMADNTPLAFQALAIRSNMQVIPVGYRAPEQGEYTFRLNEATSSIDLLNEQYEQLVLVDYQTGELTNLLIVDYTFYSERTQADNRFAIYAVPRQNAPTDLPNAIGQDKQAQKIIHNGHLYILRDGNVYNGNGQIVK